MKFKLLTALVLLTIPLWAQQLEVEKLTTLVMPRAEQFYSPDGSLMVTGNRGGVALFNVTDINNPVYITNIELGVWTYCRAAVFHNNYLILGTGAFFKGVLNPGSRIKYILYVYDISDPENPVRISEREFSGGIDNLWVYGPYLIINASGNIYAYDFSNAPSLFSVGGYGVSSSGLSHLQEASLMIDENLYLYSRDALRILSMEDPANITEVSRRYMLEEEFAYYGYYNYYDPISLIDNDYLIAFSDKFMYKIDVTNPANPATIGTIPVAEDVNAFGIKGEYAYAAYDKDSHTDILKIYDIGGEEEPALVDSFDVAAEVTGMGFKGNKLVLTAQHQFYIYDISNPLNPVYEKTNNFSWFNWLYEEDGKLIGNKGGDFVTQDYGSFKNFTSFHVDKDAFSYLKGYKTVGTTLYATKYSYGLAVYDVTDKLAPIRLDAEAEYEHMLSKELDVSVNEELLFAADYDTLCVYDITGKTNPAVVQEVKVEFPPRSITVSGDMLVVDAIDRMMVYTIDETNKNITLLKALTDIGTPYGYGEVVCIVDKKIYINHVNGVLRVIDMTDADSPVITQTDIPSIGRSESIMIEKRDNLIFAMSYSTFGIYHIDNETGDVSLVFSEEYDIRYTEELYELQVADEYVFLRYAESYPVYHVDFTTGVTNEPDIKQLPSEFELSQNYPNPFNPRTRINFTLPNAGWAELTIHDPLGRKVETLLSGETTAGTHQVTFNAEGYPSGVYIYTLRYNTLQKGLISKSVKMLLLK